MATLFNSLWPSSWFGSDPIAQTQALVEARVEPLKTNDKKVDEIAHLRERLKVCFETVKAANPTLFATLNAPPPETITLKEMGNLIKILTLATVTNLQDLSQDLEKVRQQRELLEQLVTIWERVNADSDQALESGSQAVELDTKNIEALTKLQQQAQNLGLPPTCHTDTIL